ncbi:restriction endonuclease subunit S [Altericista sp. CCNU0014]|uniref:restriction endonuclease subunit S n=1 Tax=Altericista sp. CCNU0014 TaxID=3082949 RepID=UPI00384C5A27
MKSLIALQKEQRLHHLGFKFTTKGILFVKVESLSAQRINHKLCGFIDKNADEALSRSRLQENDVLFSIAGTLGRVAIVYENDLPSNTNQAISIIRLIPPILPKYIAHFLSSPLIEKNIQAIRRGMGLQNLNLGQISKFQIPLAPLNEQKRIADKLDRLLAKVDACRERCDRIPLLLKRFRQSVLAAATSGELTEDWREKYSVVEPEKSLIKEKRFKIADSDENLQLLPETWKWDALGNYAQCSRGRFSVRPRNDPAYFNGKHPFIQIGDLPSEGGWIDAHKQTLNEKGLTVSKKFPKATVVIALMVQKSHEDLTSRQYSNLSKVTERGIQCDA